VYARNAESPGLTMAHLFASVPPFRANKALASRAAERLTTWHSEHVAGLLASGLADWIAHRPVVR